MPHPQVLRDMALFVEVAKRKSFSQAALALEMPVSSLSRRITVFEQAIGVRLLDRTTRRINLTSYGEVYFAQALSVVEEAQRAYDGITAEAKGASGLLRIAAPPDGWALHHLSTVVSEYKADNRNVQVQVDLSHGPVDLMGGRYDLVLAVEPPRESTLIVRKIAEVENAIFASPAYLDEWGLPEAPRDLADHSVIVAGPSAEWVLNRGGETVTATVSGPIASNSPTMARRFAIAGHGLFAVHPFHVRHHVQGGALVQVMSDWQLRPTPIYIVTTSRLLPAKVRTFIEFAAKRLANSLGSPLLEEAGESAEAERAGGSRSVA